MTLTIGLDVGGTKVLGALVAPDGRLVADDRVETPAHDADAFVDALVGLTGALREKAPDEPTAVGVGAAGMITPDGIIRYSPNIPALREVPLAARLHDLLGLPVVVDNDANAAAWGEVAHGAAAGHDEALVVTLGTGIGGGIVTRGRLLRGANGFAAEIGHFQVVDGGPTCSCGERGHWEAVASGTALGNLGREAAARGDVPAVLDLAGGDPELVTGRHVSMAALDGDPDALAVLDDFARLVALGLAGLVNILDPGIVVVGGGLVTLGDTLLAPLRRELGARVEAPGHRPAVPVVLAQLGERAGAIGAAALARAEAGG